MICYANHYSYLTTCRVATLVLMAAHSAGPLLMLTATPSESHPHLTGRDVTNEWETDRNLMLGCVSLAAHTLVCVRP